MNCNNMLLQFIIQITSLPAILGTILATLSMIVPDNIHCQSMVICQMNYLYKACSGPLLPKRVIGRVSWIILLPVKNVVISMFLMGSFYF